MNTVFSVYEYATKQQHSNNILQFVRELLVFDVFD